jgi:transposase
VLIALVVTPEGFPINYEVLAGNTAEKTTLIELMNKIENLYGKARRVWLMDRGIPTEQSLAFMREIGMDYLVGTPRQLLDEFQKELIDKDWQQVNESVRVKHLENKGECFVLACSRSRMAKERAMRKRKLRDYLEGLAKLKNYRDWQRFTKRLGVLEHQAGSCRHCVDLQLPDQGKRVTNFDFSLNHQKYREMIGRDGMYCLRTNQTGKEAVELWQQYMLQCNVEQAFKDMKSDLGIRPVYHHKEPRVDAHIFVAFLSYCLQTTLRHKLRRSASGLTAQAVLETLCRIQMLDVTFETQDNRVLLMQRYTEPQLEHKLILSHLRMELPPQKPPKIYHNRLEK